MRGWVHRSSRFIAAVVISVGVPALVTLVVPHDIERTNVPGGFMLVGVLGATALGGLWYGLAAAGLAVLTLDLFFLGASGLLSFGAGADRLAAAVYAFVAFGLVALFEGALRRIRNSEHAATRLEARLVAERGILQEMQHALLPQLIALKAPIELGLCYRGADAPDRIGGDWYAVMLYEGNRIGLAIGDVAGNGLTAVATMAEVRFALRTLAFEPIPPETLLASLNQLLLRFRPDAMVTALYGVLDLGDNEWEFASAGHLPPLVRGPSGTRYCQNASGPPLGVSDEWRGRTQRVRLEPGATLVLFTDGLVERRDEVLDAGLERLRRVVSEDDDMPGELCDRLMRRLVGAHQSDDAAVLAARLDPIGTVTTPSRIGRVR